MAKNTAAAGKRQENKLADRITDIGWIAERVPRSVADAHPIDDVIAAPPGTPHADHEHRPLTRALSEHTIDPTDIVQIEVKWTTSGGYAASTLYSAHLETIGLGTNHVLEWGDNAHTGGLRGYLSFLEVWCVDVRECDVRARMNRDPFDLVRGTNDHTFRTLDDEETLPKSTRDAIPEDVPAAHSALAVRQPNHPFVLAW